MYTLYSPQPRPEKRELARAQKLDFIDAPIKN
jgi:hypothetical protein